MQTFSNVIQRTWAFHIAVTIGMTELQQFYFTIFAKSVFFPTS